ncbi:MAG: hypothetical protein L0312_33510, partial [Acidobacteria bacterium]|nr:hypothetical protein [Acidobacteriota bacterium]
MRPPGGMPAYKIEIPAATYFLESPALVFRACSTKMETIGLAFILSPVVVRVANTAASPMRFTSKRRFSFQHFDNRGVRPFPAFVVGLNDDRGWNVVVADTHTFSPTLVLDLRASYARHETKEVSPSFGFDLKTLRFPQNFVDFAQPFIPMFNISGVTSLGRNRSLIQPRETPA